MATEKRLIDANKFFEQLEEEFHGMISDSEMKVYQILSRIEEQPTVDAVEVVHGHWIFKHDPINDPKKYFVRIVCSECNLHTGQKSNYCPNCGAKMDGERRNDGSP